MKVSDQKNNFKGYPIPDANISLTKELFDEIKTIEVLPDDVEKFRLKYGDIILTEGGAPDKVERGAVWKFDVQDCIHQNHIFRVRANPEILHWDYLSALLGSKYGKKYFLKWRIRANWSPSSALS
ncbi:MAG: hypothetical protein WCM76_16485 [Bacteroidota bacterium]